MIVFHNLVFCWFLAVAVSAVPNLSNSSAAVSAVIIDSRFDASVVASIMNTRQHLPLRVKIHLMTDKKYWAEARKLFFLFDNIEISSVSYSQRTIQDYNKFLLSEYFWSLFQDDYILIFQRDSRFCSRSRHRLFDFVGMFDYIGAPWPKPVSGNVVGNGGFSLRNREAMIFCVKWKFLQRSINEDVAFADCLRKNGYRLSDAKRANEFSVEMIRLTNHTPLAVHKPWAYISSDKTMALLCPESVWRVL